MLADPTFAEMVQAIGEASLGADEKTIWHLTKVTHGLVFCEMHDGAQQQLQHQQLKQ